MADEHRLVVVGGGIAGLDVATRLARRRTGGKRLSVTLVDREAAYVWKPILHTIAAGTSDAGMQETIYAAQARTRGFHFSYGEAVGIDRARREVQLAPVTADGEEIVPARTIGYDTLVLAVGSRANDFGTPGVAEHCASIDSRSGAVAFNDRLRHQLLKAIVAGSTLTVGIVGGGATGVELAAELIQVASVAEHFGIAAASDHLKVVLIESGPRLLGPFPERVSNAVRHKLEQLGVEIRTGTRVTAVEASGFTLDGGETVSAGLKVWAAGVKAPPLMDALADLERTRSVEVAVGQPVEVRVFSTAPR